MGAGLLAAFASRPVGAGAPDATRVLIVVHGEHRNARATFRAGLAAMRDAPGTLVVAPQFLDDADAAAFGLPAAVLRWHGSAWEGGRMRPAPRPRAVSRFSTR